MPKVRTATAADRIVREANDRGVGPTPERLKRAGEAVEPFNSDLDKHTHYDTIRLMDGDGGILDQLIRERKISTDEYHSGLRFFRDFHYSGMDAVRALDWTRPVVDSSVSVDITDKRLDAVNSASKAMARLGYLGMHPIMKMIIQGVNPKDYAKERWPLVGPRDARSQAVGALCASLAILDEFFYGQRKTRVVAAGVEGYRPSGLSEER